MRDAAAEAVTLERIRRRRGMPWHGPHTRALCTGPANRRCCLRQAQEALSATAPSRIIRIIGLSALSFIAADRGDLERQSSTRGQRAKSWTALARAWAQRRRAASPTQPPAASSPGAGGLAEARSEFERALRIRRSQPGISPWPTLEILVRLAPVLLETGDRPGAAALLEEARLLLTSSPAGAGAQLARLARSNAGSLPGRGGSRVLSRLPPAR